MSFIKLTTSGVRDLAIAEANQAAKKKQAIITDKFIKACVAPFLYPFLACP
jgi:hypothetical protein